MRAHDVSEVQEVVRELIRRTCARKSAFSTRDEAKRAVGRMVKQMTIEGPLVTYRCGAGNHYHLGHKIDQ